MKTIFVHFWGYKSKNLPEAVNSLVQNQSGNNKVIVSVYDKTNIDRKEKFVSNFYNHVSWDTLESQYHYLDLSLRTSNTDFFMYVDGAIKFEKDWDVELVMSSCDRDVVISGNTDIHFTDEYKFYPSYERTSISCAKVVNWVSQDFIFMNSLMFKNFPSLSSLKYRGIEDVYSLYAAHKSIPVQCIPTSWCSRIDSSIFDSDYVPFSISHNYSQIIDIYNGKKNIFFDDLECAKVLSSLINYDLDKLSNTPFSVNDISYSQHMNIDGLGSERFLKNVRSIG